MGRYVQGNGRTKEMTVFKSKEEDEDEGEDGKDLFTKVHTLIASIVLVALHL